MKREIAGFVRFDAAASEQGMDNKTFGRRTHRCAPYTHVALVVCLLLWCGATVHAKEMRRIGASGKTAKFAVSGAGGSHAFVFNAISGCRYRITVVPGTLSRPILSLGRWRGDPFARVDAQEDGKVIEHIFDAEEDERMQATVSGFSALTGDGTIKVETLDARDRPTKAHRRVLGTTSSESARVGHLLIGEPNRWDLDVKPGVAYQVTPTVGSAGRVRLQILAGDQVVADSEATGLAMHSHPPVRFQVPGAADQGAPTLRLEVRGLFDGGGTYGLRLRPLVKGETVEPPKPELPAAPPAEILPGPIPTFRAGPGDLAVLYVPNVQGNPHRVQVLRGSEWIEAEGHGQAAGARSKAFRGMHWFRPYSAGTFRFLGARGHSHDGAKLSLQRRADVGGVPIHLGTGVDPQVRVRVHSKWTLAGVGACMPGWDYLFVAVGAPGNGVGLRIVGPKGKTVKTRGYSGVTYVADTGPSVRFRPKLPGIYRLEIRSRKKRVVAALLRHASN